MQHLMTLNAGATLGPYKIESPLGAGGMGEVYLARDTRLDRTVAIKILPSHLSENSEAKQRFDREARMISLLNHPNICTLYDVGHQDGVDYLVMEHLEGETLADRLRKGPLPIAQLLKCSIEICDGLEKAHRSGVVHRDLKPGNIMLTKTAAKLMDFGLAKASIATAGSATNLTVTLSTPAQSHPLTAQGSVVGTFQYMAPEQIEGREADARSDIFAFGAVLYEMATAKRAFEGKTAASAMAAVLERDPAPISSVQPASPLALDRLVKTCLAKDPDERWQTAHDVKLQLKQIAEGGSQTSVAIPGVERKHPGAKWGWVAASILSIVAALALGTAYLAEQKTPPLLRFEVTPPPKMQFNVAGDNAGPAVISPDGRLIVFSASGIGAAAQLYARSLDSLSVQPLPGTEGGLFPFWSPDSKSIAFFTADKLKRVEISGGQPVSICDATLGRGGTWGDDGTIIAALSYNTGLWRVSAKGGTPVALTKPDNVQYSSHRWPTFLPDGQHFLYMAVNHTNPNSADIGVFFASLDGKENRLLVHAAANAIYASGYLLYPRENSLVARPFDPAKGKFIGDAESLGENVQFDAATWRTNLSASSNGMLVYASAAASRNDVLNWYDRDGKELGRLDDPGAFQEVQLSPDQSALALTDQNTAAATIWIYDLKSKLKTRLSFGGGVRRSPAWSPDGRQIAYTANQQANIAVKEIGGGAPERILLSSPDGSVASVSNWSSDGRYLLYLQGHALNLNLWVLPLFGDRTPFKYAKSTAYEWYGVFSPDGRWVAFSSNETGRPTVFVAPFPWTGEKWQISSSDGIEPQWRADGKEIYYFNFAEIAAVDVDGSGPAFKVGNSKKLFPVTLKGLSQEYAVTRDGQRFVAITPGGGTLQPLTVVQNWPAQLKKK